VFIVDQAYCPYFLLVTKVRLICWLAMTSSAWLVMGLHDLPLRTIWLINREDPGLNGILELLCLFPAAVGCTRKL
jgi:hypothetical protein